MATASLSGPIFSDSVLSFVAKEFRLSSGHRRANITIEISARTRRQGREHPSDARTVGAPLVREVAATMSGRDGVQERCWQLTGQSRTGGPKVSLFNLDPDSLGSGLVQVPFRGVRYR